MYAIRYQFFCSALPFEVLIFSLAEKFADPERLATVKSSDIREVAVNSLSPKSSIGFSSGLQFPLFFGME